MKLISKLKPATASNVAGLSYWNELMLDQLQYMGSERESRVPPAAHAYFPKVERVVT